MHGYNWALSHRENPTFRIWQRMRFVVVFRSYGKGQEKFKCLQKNKSSIFNSEYFFTRIPPRIPLSKTKYFGHRKGQISPFLPKCNAFLSFFQCKYGVFTRKKHIVWCLGTRLSLKITTTVVFFTILFKRVHVCSTWNILNYSE